MKLKHVFGPALLLAGMFVAATVSAEAISGAIYTSTGNHSQVNANSYPLKEAVYLNGGPSNAPACNGGALDNDDYYFQVTNPSGSTLLSTDAIENRKFRVTNGRITLNLGTHVNGGISPCGSLAIQLWPFADTDNNGGEYKVWITRVTDYSPGNGTFGFVGGNTKTDNFKVERVVPLQVSKTANTSFNRTFEWTIDKAVAPSSADVFVGDTHDFGFTVTVTKSAPIDSGWSVSGSISIVNPNSIAGQIAMISGVTDVISDGLNATVDCPVTFPHGLNPGATLTCTYSRSLPNGNTRLNTATATTSGSIGGSSGTADVVFGTPTTVTNNSVTVSDSQMGTLGTTSSSTSYQYTVTLDCDSRVYENVASIVGTSLSDEASATLNCHEVTAAKTAEGTYARHYEWDLAKRVLLGPAGRAPVADINGSDCVLLGEAQFPGFGGYWACGTDRYFLPDGMAFEPVYLIELAKSHDATNDDHTVSGTVSYTFPTALADKLVISGISDTITFGGGGSHTFNLNLATCSPSVVNGDTTVTCSYSESAGPDNPAIKSGNSNEATVTRTTQCFNAEGSVKAACGGTQDIDTASVGFDFSEANSTDHCVTLQDVFGSGEVGTAGATVDLAGERCGSDAFLLQGAPYAISFANIESFYLVEGEVCIAQVPNEIIATSTDDGSAMTPVSSAAIVTFDLGSAGCQVNGGGCTLTQGYWKTHSICGPASKPNSTWDVHLKDSPAASCRKRDNGTVYKSFGSSDLSWLDVLWTPSSGGNPYYILAHQYIAAWMNIEAGASDASISGDMAWAATFFGTYTPSSFVKVKGKYSSVAIANAAAMAVATAGRLDDYNNGVLPGGPQHCSVVVQPE